MDEKLKEYYIIKVNTGSLPNGYGPILEYYNKNKKPDDSNLKKSDTCEGGFEIEGQNSELRWANRHLVRHYKAGFTIVELDLLYEALVNELGENNVEKIYETNNIPHVPTTYHVRSMGGGEVKLLNVL